MEKEIKIPTSDRKLIYGTLRGSLRKPLIVFVHGLGGNMNDHQFFNGARYFERNGFSSFRFNLYDWRKGGRKLHECTLATHGRDLNRVIEYLRRKGAKRIFVVGHSYGGKTILMSQRRNFNAAVFWDPSHNSYLLFKRAKYVPSLKNYVDTDWPYWVVIGKKMVDKERKFPWREKIRQIQVPIKIICAEKGVLVKGCKAYYAAANKPKAIAIIKGATHGFDEDGAEEKLFSETLKWLNRFKK